MIHAQAREAVTRTGVDGWVVLGAVNLCRVEAAALCGSDHLRLRERQPRPCRARHKDVGHVAARDVQTRVDVMEGEEVNGEAGRGGTDHHIAAVGPLAGWEE